MESKLLPEVCKIQYGFPFDAARFSNSDGKPLVRIRDVIRGYSETYTTESCGSEYIVQNGDMLIGMDGEFNIAKWNGGEALLNQRVCKLIPTDVDSGYLFYYMPKILKQIEAETPYVTVKHLSAKRLNEITIPIPSMQYQKRIATVLDKISALITLRKQQLAKLDELVKARFVEMFGLPRTDVKGWGLTALGKCCQLNPRRPKDMATDMDYSFVAMPSVSEDGRIDPSILRPYSEICKGFTYFEENDVLFAKITPCMENGKGGIAIGLKNGAGFGSTEFHILRPIQGKSNPYWLYAITSFKMFRINAAKVMTGTGGQRRVPLSYLEEYPITLPPLDLQERFAAFMRQSEKTRLTIQRGLAKLETLKRALMQEYFG